MGFSLHEVEAPDMVGVFRPEPNAPSVVEPETGPFGLFLWDFRPLAAPDALDPVLANLNAAVIQQCRHPTVAMAATLRGKIDNVPGQLIFIGSCRGNISLCSPGLPDNPAGGAFAEPACFTSCVHRLPAPFRAYKFPCATSCRTCLSSDRLGTRFFSLPFSVSSCFRRLA